MKKMVFIREAGTQRLVAEVKEISGLSGDGCSVVIKDKLMIETSKLGITKLADGKRFITSFYKFGDITLIRVADNRYCVFDSDINDVWIGDLLKKYSIQYHYSHSKDEQKHTVRISLPDVIRVNRKKTKVRGNHSIALNKYLWDVELGKAGNPADLYIYDKKESHHEKASWDNRIRNTMNLSRKEHEEHHKVISSKSHQTLVDINTLEELEAFLEYLKNN